ncbi:leucine-rich repeat neuronal protein 2-like isoform X2 [Pseudomyrmex gracilis]|uniref:leucine-rich repeat neuronal protein 2-like isoform X2 n=1 Tax=Pseudomyrmex gracilis TaxID=219809 RepID=UPI000994E8F8|nr:leucine-rich repeat neuronal protein 2-like isoform X2 [Pseudomyrmex gracilis]
MDLHLVLASLLALVLVTKCDVVKHGTAIANENQTTISSGTTSKSASLCIVCTCTDGYIDCSNRSLENHFEESEWSNVTVTEISFEHNRLVHVTPFPKIIVEKLILRMNQISRIDNQAFKELVNLTELDLSHNQLKSEYLSPHIFEGKFSPNAYEPLSNLKTLSLAGNLLHWLHPSIFEHLPSLEVLNISGNPFNVFDYRTSIAISSLSYLEDLDISYCDLKNLSLQFHNAKYLKRLNLANNKFTTVPTSLEDAKELEYLRLDFNPIRVIDHTNGFPNLTLLKELSLCYMANLTEIGNGGLSALIGLENLYMHHCEKLVKIDDYAMSLKVTGALWPPLKKLDLTSNSLQYLPMLLVGRWDKLEELHLTHNNWSCDCNNQYLIDHVLPQFGEKLMGPDAINELTCSAPPEHAGKKLTSLAKRHLRCLDLYGAQPEKDAAILIGVLIGILLAIPVCLAIFVLWRRGFFFCGSQGPASFSRAFYKRASNDDDF